MEKEKKRVCRTGGGGEWEGERERVKEKRGIDRTGEEWEG